MVSNATAPGKATNLASSTVPAIDTPAVETPAIETPVEPVMAPKIKRGRPKKDAEA